jgi:hypothetical protein
VKAIDVTRLRERRVFQGRKFEARPALFPGSRAGHGRHHSGTDA